MASEVTKAVQLENGTQFTDDELAEKILASGRTPAEVLGIDLKAAFDKWVERNKPIGHEQSIDFLCKLQDPLFLQQMERDIYLDVIRTRIEIKDEISLRIRKYYRLCPQNYTDVPTTPTPTRKPGRSKAAPRKPK